MQEIIDQFVAADRFNMRALAAQLLPGLEDQGGNAQPIDTLKRKLGHEQARSVLIAILRHVFLIELVKIPAIETTKVRARWFGQLVDDPRYCAYEECAQIANQLVRDLPGWLDTNSHTELLALFCAEGFLPYEAPIDYLQRPADNAPIHTLGNVSWYFDELILRTLKLRRFLRSPETSPDSEFFRRVLDDKIKIKTYLTDRALTGDFKTNREKRWETHPKSVQFALRRTCLEIEYTLVTQLCAFKDFPAESRELLQTEGVLPAELPTFRCPVTQEPMSFPLFRDALINPQHGRSDFQVGHLNPLKLDEPGDNAAGHTADNISWISADGNRIQGSLSLTAVRKLLRKIAANYEVLKLL